MIKVKLSGKRRKMKRPGRLVRLHDDRVVIVYNDQPLLEKGKIVLTLVDGSYNPLLDSNGKSRTILMGEELYKEEMQVSKFIGYID